MARIALLVLPLIILFSVYRSLEWHRAHALLSNLGLAVFIIPFPYAIAAICDSLAFQRVLANLGCRIPLRRLVPIRFSCEAVNLSISGGWAIAEGLGPYLLQQREGVPATSGLAAGALRKCLIFLAQTIYLSLAAVVGFRFFRQISPEVLGNGSLPFLALGGAFAFLWLAATVSSQALSGSLAGRVHRMAARLPGRIRRFVDTHSGRAERLDRELARVRGTRLSHLTTPLFLYLFLWMIEASETFLILHLLGVPARAVDVWAFDAAVIMIRYFVIAIVPAGLGIQELGYLIFFRAAGYPDPVTLSAAFSLLKRLREVLWVLLGLGMLTVLRGCQVLTRASTPIGGP